MISVIVPTFNDAERLAACLAPLVPASMSGVVRELIVVDRGSTDETLEVADDAGAQIIPAETLDGALSLAKGPWLLILDPAVRLEFGWETVAKRHMEGKKAPARFRIDVEEGGFLTRILPPPVAALLIRKTDVGGLTLVRKDARLQARVGQVHVLNARGRV